MKRQAVIKGCILLITSSLVVIGGAAVVPALPQIRDQFITVPHSDLLARMILALPNLMITLCAFFAGWIIDRIGRRKLLISGLFLYVASGSLPFFLTSIYPILLCRLVFGIALASLMTTSTTLIADYFSGEQRNRLMGVQAGCMAFGAMAVLLLSGFCADISWRAPFLMYLCALCVIPLAFKYIHEPKRNETHPEKTFLFGRDTLKKTSPVYIVAYSSMVVFFILPAFLPFYIKESTFVDNKSVALVIACMSGVRGCIALLYGMSRRWIHFNSVFILIFTGMALGYGIIGFSEHYIQILIGALVCGAGLGFLLPNLTAWAMEYAPLEHRGKVIGGLTMSIYFGQFSSPLILSPLVSFCGMARSFIVLGCALLLFAGFFTVLNLKKIFKRNYTGFN